MSRTNRPRKARGRSRVGERFEAEVGPVAHGGHCVARLPEPEARVVFVRLMRGPCDVVRGSAAEEENVVGCSQVVDLAAGLAGGDAPAAQVAGVHPVLQGLLALERDPRRP